ncbi:MAG: SdrD B-like domain-containing protein, partial [Acidobacteriota bacterium]
DPAEPGLESVAVRLYDATDASLLESTVTDSAGAYRFVARPDRYFLEFEAPPVYRFTAQDRGADEALDSDVEPSTGRTVEFSGVEDGTWDAGLTNGIGDRVWLDLDADGIQDGGEPGVADVAVELFDQTDASIASTVTDVDGAYAFADLTADIYYVVFSAPDGFVLSPQAQGNDADVDSDADPVSGATSPIPFADGDLLLGIDAGLVADTGIEVLDGPEPRGASDDFQVNSTTAGFQYDPAAAKLADGSFVVTWQSAASSGDDSDSLSVQVKRYRSDGSPLAGEQQVNTLTSGAQSRPDVAAAPDGGFWVVWESDVSAGDDSSSDSIQLRRFDASGDPVGTERQVNQQTGGGQRSPSIAVAGDGSALVSWFGGSDGSGNSVPGRVFDSTGAPVGDEFVVNSYTPSDQYLGDVTALDSGDFLIVWSSPTESSGRQIFGRRIGTGGVAVGGEFQISQNSGEYPSAAAGPRLHRRVDGLRLQ